MQLELERPKRRVCVRGRRFRVPGFDADMGLSYRGDGIDDVSVMPQSSGAPDTSMTRLGRCFRIAKRAFAEASAPAGGKNGPSVPASDPAPDEYRFLKGKLMQEMRSWPAVLRFPMAILRFGAGALVVCFTAVLAALRGLAWLLGRDSDETSGRQHSIIATSWSDKDFDNPVVWRKRR